METSTLFFILAGLLIAILIGHSLWSARREKSRVFSNTFTTRPASAPVGSQTAQSAPETFNSEGFNHHQPAPEHETEEQRQAYQQEIDNQVRDFNITLADQDEPNVVRTQSTPFNDQHHAHTTQSSYQESYQDSSHIQPEPTPVRAEETEQADHQSTPNTEPQMMMLYVVAPEGQAFNGLNVVHQLDNLGLQYGEYQIFHRHLDLSDSPVLFSVANMMQPGIFDLNTIEQFSTIGLVFFMHLPSPSNDLANLRIMISTADSLAQSLGGFVLNDQQQIFDERARQEYVQRIRQA